MLTLEGQVYGGIGQGIGQVFGEQIIYDADGQMLTGSFLDYGMPRADDMCSFDLANNPVPTARNPLGVKGGSESGTIGAPAAIGNAVVDALWHLGVRHVPLPITSQTVWRALRTATNKGNRT